ncbi:MAG: hypothetical protein OXG08_03115 [Gammaproteobacteria bacterium]|nr:hypothetical protein [Gammaproteobacteria bacterium]
MASAGQLTGHIETLFERFSNRTLPATIWREDHWDVDYYKKGFDPVLPREFDFDVFESHPFHGQSDRLAVMTIEGVLFYLPSFLTLVLRDLNRCLDLDLSIFYSLRGFVVSNRNLDNWIAVLRQQPSFHESLTDCHDAELKRTILEFLNWFVLKVQPCQSAVISNMTQPEREIVAESVCYYDQALKTENPLERESGKHLVESVRGLLLNGPLSRRLGASDDSDLARLICLLDLAESKYPKCITHAVTRPIREELKAVSLRA